MRAGSTRSVGGGFAAQSSDGAGVAGAASHDAIGGGYRPAFRPLYAVEVSLEQLFFPIACSSSRREGYICLSLHDAISLGLAEDVFQNL